MLRRIFFTAVCAGVLAGLGVTVLQEATTTPLVRYAERFEHVAPERHGALGRDFLSPGMRVAGRANADDAPYPHAHLSAPAHAHGGHAAGAAHPTPHAGGGPAIDAGRLAYTAAANVLIAIGFALALTACFVVAGRPVRGRDGLLWGSAGFAAVSLAPALGLPPELPGLMTAELGARQGWWLLCAAATAGGLWLLAFSRGARWIVAGLALVVLPHLIGAPRPPGLGGTAPPELAAHFVAASLVTAAVFWAGLGWLCGTFWDRSAIR